MGSRALVMSDDQSYTDRFGHTWSVRAKRPHGTSRHVVFTCGEIQLIATHDGATSLADLTAARLKDLFCRAERVLVHGNEKWYVGYRERSWISPQVNTTYLDVPCGRFARTDHVWPNRSV